MKTTLLLASLLVSSLALAETTAYEVEGMHCGACAKKVKAEVCNMPGIQSCDVSVGKVKISTKKGVEISQDQIQAAIAKAGEYKIIGSEKSK